MAEFEIFKDDDGHFRWRLRASGNNEPIADSGEGYTTKENCQDGIDLVKAQAATATVQDLT
jgi:uncharacterized protein YegP (UPF0339 family)